MVESKSDFNILSKITGAFMAAFIYIICSGFVALFPETGWLYNRLDHR